MGLDIDGSGHFIDGNVITNLNGGAGGEASRDGHTPGLPGSGIGIWLHTTEHRITSTNTYERNLLYSPMAMKTE